MIAPTAATHLLLTTALACSSPASPAPPPSGASCTASRNEPTSLLDGGLQRGRVAHREAQRKVRAAAALPNTCSRRDRRATRQAVLT